MIRRPPRSTPSNSSAASDVYKRQEHENAAEQIYQALQAYYTDNREYPCKASACTVASLLEAGGDLDPYIDDFDGGSEASYTYRVNTTGAAQECVVCVTYGGDGDGNQLGMYCTGNAIGMDSTEFGVTVPSTKDMEYCSTDYQLGEDLFIATWSSDWNPAATGGTKWETFDSTMECTP